MPYLQYKIIKYLSQVNSFNSLDRTFWQLPRNEVKSSKATFSYLLMKLGTFTMESNEENPKPLASKKKKKFLPHLINPNHLDANEVSLISHLNQTHLENRKKVADIQKFSACGKLFRKMYKVSYRNPSNNNQPVVQRVRFTEDIHVYPLMVLNPANLKFSELEWVTYLYQHHPGLNHFIAGQPYIAAIPDYDTPSKLLQRPLLFTKDLILHDAIEVNPSDLTKKTKELLTLLLKNNPKQSFFDSTDPVTLTPKKYLVQLFDEEKSNEITYQIIRLSQPLVRYLRKPPRNSRFFEAGNYAYRYAICNAIPIEGGLEGEGYLSEVTLKFNPMVENDDVVFKKKDEEKSRFIKVYLPPRDLNRKIKREESGELYDPRTQNQKAGGEWHFLKKISMFAIKSPILTENEQRAALIMRCMKGRPLIDFIIEDEKDSLFTEDQRIDISIMIGEALLNQIHFHGIIHRDIKPDNMILHVDENNNPVKLVIVDFGIAKWDFENDINEGCGTKIYKSPEAAKKKNTTQKSDAYSYTKILSIFWHDYSDGRFRTLHSDHRIEILDIIKKGLDFDMTQRAGVEEIISTFKSIKEKRQLALNLQSPTMHL